MKKTVTKLKKKHRDYIWKDEEGDYWYWDSTEQQWCVLMADIEGGFYISTEFDPAYYQWFERALTSTLAGI